MIRIAAALIAASLWVAGCASVSEIPETGQATTAGPDTTPLPASSTATEPTTATTERVTALNSSSTTTSPPTIAEVPSVKTGAQVLVESNFAVLDGMRVGLITNQVSMIEGRHLIDWLNEAPNVELVRVFAAEHGVRGDADAGEEFGNDVDPATGTPVVSLYTEAKKPTPAMLEGLDAIVFDLQDVGTRYFTYTATMGLAMEAATEAGIRFVVLDRPNPLGGQLIEGFMRTDDQASFISQYPLPAVHGLTAGELAKMIKGQGWLSDMSGLDLEVIEAASWDRSMRWEDTSLAWIAPSPGLQTAASAATYPAIVLLEPTTLSYAAGTDLAFQAVGAPWLDADALAGELNTRNLPGVRFDLVSFTARRLPGIGFDLRYEDEPINGVQLVVTDPESFRPTATGVHLLEVLNTMATEAGQEWLDRPATLDLLAGTAELRRLLLAGVSANEIIASWEEGELAFAEASRQYRIYQD